MLNTYRTFCSSFVPFLTIICLCYLFKSRHQIVTICNICHLGLFILLYSHLWHKGGINGVLVPCCCSLSLFYCFSKSFSSFFRLYTSLSTYLFVWIISLSLICWDGFVNITFLSCFGILDNSWLGIYQDECLTLSI